MNEHYVASNDVSVSKTNSIKEQRMNINNFEVTQRILSSDSGR